MSDVKKLAVSMTMDFPDGIEVVEDTTGGGFEAVASRPGHRTHAVLMGFGRENTITIFLAPMSNGYCDVAVIFEMVDNPLIIDHEAAPFDDITGAVNRALARQITTVWEWRQRLADDRD